MSVFMFDPRDVHARRGHRGSSCTYVGAARKKNPSTL